MTIPSSGFTILVNRLRVEQRGSGSGKRYRTVGDYSCYMNGALINDPNLQGASVEPRGPGDNSSTGVTYARRIKAGKYPLGSHGFAGAKYSSFNYRKSSRPYPGLYVRRTNKRTAILIHMGSGFKASVGCLNFTGSIAGPNDMIGRNTSFARMDYLINYMKAHVPGFPNTGGAPIPGANLVIVGEP